MVSDPDLDYCPSPPALQRLLGTFIAWLNQMFCFLRMFQGAAQIQCLDFKHDFWAGLKFSYLFIYICISVTINYSFISSQHSSETGHRLNQTDKNTWNRVTLYLTGSKSTSSRSIIIIGPLRCFEPFFLVQTTEKDPFSGRWGGNRHAFWTLITILVGFAHCWDEGKITEQETRPQKGHKRLPVVANRFFISTLLLNLKRQCLNSQYFT